MMPLVQMKHGNLNAAILCYTHVNAALCLHSCACRLNLQLPHREKIGQGRITTSVLVQGPCYEQHLVIGERQGLQGHCT